MDQDAEDFILNWAQEFPLDEPIDLVIHLQKLPEDKMKPLVEEGIHNYFAYRARLNQMEFRRLMRQGRTSLLVGVSFLGICLLINEVLLAHALGILPDFVQQGVTIVGWVAMWRPMEIYLYEWWPLRHKGLVFKKLSTMPIEVRLGTNVALDPIK